MLDFEWDEDKNRANFAKHGIWFEDAVQIFNGPIVTRPDDRFNYNELREKSLGLLRGIAVVAVIHTDRDGIVRVISARAATRKERKDYDTSIGPSD